MPKGIPRDSSVNHAIIHRLQIAHGQLQAVIDMIKNGAYCIDVINQSQAVQAALKQTDHVIMHNHLATCAAEEIKKGNTRAIIKEVMDVMNTNCKDCSCKNCTCLKDKNGKCTCGCKDCSCNK